MGRDFRIEGTTIRQRKDQNDKEMWRSIGLYSFMSLNLAFMIVGGYFIGRLVERNFHIKNAMVTGVLIGLFIGFYELFKIAFKAGRMK